MECTGCGAELDFRVAFCSTCGEVTSKGRPFGGSLASPFDGIGERAHSVFASIRDVVLDPANRKIVIPIGAGLAFLFVAVSENPLTVSLRGWFEDAPEAPSLHEDGTPNLAAYEDVFLSEQTEYFVTGPANVRDYPTGQRTNVIAALSEGETVMAREVQAFDPTSQWLKLEGGGYVWGANLLNVDQIAHEAGHAFPTGLQGKWSDRNSCAGLGSDTEINVAFDEVSFGAAKYALVDIVNAGTEPPGYQLSELRDGVADGSGLTLQEDARWPVIWVSYDGDVTGKGLRYFRSALPCADVMTMAAEMSR